ncbi:YiiD C-terminal domain-containing protein [Frateuria defendens]|uniref:YiiD C-terminal domain-containing protein n=1 Tax=Frateuria defendens TaxID=2219559 RepID=UPI00066FF6CF|nr:YiiD C-terminal domain-containing protein [Frateuria defendens]
MTDTDLTTQAEQLLHFIRDEIPLARAMDVCLHACDTERLSLAVPLPPNANDKGCAFGGSLVSLMTLAGWALVELTLRRHGEDCDVYVADSSVRYLEPVWGDFHAEARAIEQDAWMPFLDTLAVRGRARIELSCQVPGPDGAPAATLVARFVAKRRS